MYAIKTNNLTKKYADVTVVDSLDLEIQKGEFLRRGLTGRSLGPLVLAVLYFIHRQKSGITTLTVNEVCVGIISLSVLGFIASGMNVVYQLEQLPLMVAVTIHGMVLYISYFVTYLVNGWLPRGLIPITLFTVFFVCGYIAIWVIIYCITKKRTAQLNKILRLKQNTIRNK